MVFLICFTHASFDYNFGQQIQHRMDNDFKCVDIYKQPALQHPLLKNHKIQVS
jgi:hypothetical protein